MDILEDLNSLIQYVGMYSYCKDGEINIFLPPGEKLDCKVTIEEDYRVIVHMVEDGDTFITWLDADSSSYSEQKINIVKELSNRLSKWYPNLKDPFIPSGKFTVMIAISGDVTPALKVAQYTYPDLVYNKAIEKYVQELLQGKLDADLKKKYVVKVLGSDYGQST